MIALVSVLLFSSCGGNSGGNEVQRPDPTEEEPEPSLNAEAVDAIIAQVRTCDTSKWSAIQEFMDVHLEDTRFDIYSLRDYSMETWAACSQLEARVQVAESWGIPTGVVTQLLLEEESPVLAALASNTFITEWSVLPELVDDADEDVRLAVAKFTATSNELLEGLSRDSSAQVRAEAIRNLLDHPLICGEDIQLDSYLGRDTEEVGYWWEGETLSGRLILLTPAFEADECVFRLHLPASSETIEGTWRQEALTLLLAVDDSEWITLTGSVRDDVLRLELNGEVFAKLSPRPIEVPASPSEDGLSAEP